MPDDETYRVELCNAGSEPEALGIYEHLRSQGVDGEVRAFRDTAYPGIVDRERPWGAVLVPRDDLERAKGLLAEWRDGTPEDLEEAWRASVPSTAGQSVPRPPSVGLVVLLCIVAAFVLAVVVSQRSEPAPVRFSPIAQ